MIKTENLEINGVAFVRTYSDSGRYVVRDGISYDEAIDPAEFGRTYIEGDKILPEEGRSEEDLKQEILESIIEEKLVEFPIEEEPDYFNEHSEETNYFG